MCDLLKTLPTLTSWMINNTSDDIYLPLWRSFTQSFLGGGRKAQTFSFLHNRVFIWGFTKKTVYLNLNALNQLKTPCEYSCGLLGGLNSWIKNHRPFCDTASVLNLSNAQKLTFCLDMSPNTAVELKDVMRRKWKEYFGGINIFLAEMVRI